MKFCIRFSFLDVSYRMLIKRDTFGMEAWCECNTSHLPFPFFFFYQKRTFSFTWPYPERKTLKRKKNPIKTKK